MTSADSQRDLVRRRVVYTGRVQGVCFRATTAHLSRGFEVTGYVRNMPDGTVELQAQGTLAELDRFLGAVAREFKANITDVAMDDAPKRDDESGFRITY